MSVFRPELNIFGKIPNLDMSVTHRNHINTNPATFPVRGSQINHIGGIIGSEAAVRSGGFGEAMLQALDGVSAHQQFATSLHEMAIIDPDSVDAHDITIAQAEASLSLNIARNVLNRLVQSWRDLINTR
ncbi:MAG: flagellar hook-basal body complex protein FliE [Treponema sp.]|nr:flagellar hook-basal body complex protein FliE [Treponema sp.]